MNYKKEIEQCEKDIKTLQSNLEKLKGKQENLLNIGGIELVENQGVIDYLKEHQLIRSRVKVWIIKYQGKVLLAVPLPVVNYYWTLEAFDYVIDFCRSNRNCCPVHGASAPDNDNLYIKIGGRDG